MHIKTVNTILYCRDWDAMLSFYRDSLNLEVVFFRDWFVEFFLNENARLSIADEKRASIKSSHGKGMTLSINIDDIDSVWNGFEHKGLHPTQIKKHDWGARHFFLLDPEGNRIELWQPIDS
jgi:catechol 2,3-dioxygenase-like lactoylglutathione lyase family enzyme